MFREILASRLQGSGFPDGLGALQQQAAPEDLIISTNGITTAISTK